MISWREILNEFAERPADEATCHACSLDENVEDFCETQSHYTIDMEGHSRPALLRDGWVDMTDHAGMLKRCAKHQAERPYAWAKNLDAERVSAWVAEHRPDSYGAWPLTDLKELL